MKYDTCCGIFSKLTKEERIEAIEMLIKNFNGYDEIDLIVSELDLCLSGPAAIVLNKDGKNEDEQDTSSENVAESTFIRSDYDYADPNIKRVYTRNLKEFFACDICNKLCESEQELESHKRIHVDLKTYPCSVCSETFSRSYLLKCHFKTHDIKQGRKEYDENANKCKKKASFKSKKRVICDICNKKWISKSDMERHRRVHTGEKPFSCPVCSKTYHRNSDLNWHRKSVHKEEIETGTKKFIHCEKCDKLLITNKGSYENHMKRYHDDENAKEMFPCKKCIKTFFSRRRLYAHHKRVHEKNCHFICDICSKGWGSKADLERHSSVHTGEKLFPCEKCEKKLGSKRSYEYHMKRYHV